MIKYRQEGWHVHSGARGRYTWWVACYREGKRVDYLATEHRVISFKTSESAQRKADQLNRRDGFA